MNVHDMHNLAEDEYLTAGQAAKSLPRTSPSTLLRWARQGKIPSIVLPSGRRLFRREDIDALLEPREAEQSLHTGDAELGFEPLPGLGEAS